MKNSIAILGLLFSLFMLGACSSMSPEECIATDWSAVGYEDGARGYASTSFSNHRKACAKHGVTADFQAYQEGRDEGLVEFCQPIRGYNLGVSGGNYGGVCDVALEEEFLDAYKSGYELYGLRTNVNYASAKINSRESELARTRSLVRSKQAQLISPETTTENRVMLLADIADLSEKIGQLEAQIEELVADRAHHEHALSTYENSVASFSY